MNDNSNSLLQTPQDSYSFSQISLDRDIIRLFSQNAIAQNYYQQIKFFNSQQNVYFLPDLNFITQKHSSTKNLSALRNNILHRISNDARPKIILTSINNLFCKIPAKQFWFVKDITLKRGDAVNISSLTKVLVDLGFIRVESTIAVGEFAVRGEIIDISSGDGCYRINVEWEVVADIKIIDAITQTSICSIDELKLRPHNYINSQNIEKAKVKLLQYKGYQVKQHSVFKKLEQQDIYSDVLYPLLDLFHDDLTNILTYLNNPLILLNKLYKSHLEQIELSLKSQYQEARFLLPYDKVLFLAKDISTFFTNAEIHNVGVNAFNTKIHNINQYYSHNSKTKWDHILELFNDYQDKKIVICADNIEDLSFTKDKLLMSAIKYQEVALIEAASSNLINLTNLAIEETMLIDDKYLLIASKEFQETHNVAVNKHDNNFAKLQNILSEFENLKTGDLVVHKKHGIGKFITIETLNVRDCAHDCLKISYDGNDILYVPVENIQLVKKYGSNEVSLDKLGSIVWQKRQSLQKEKIGQLAADLVKVAAQRELSKQAPIVIDEELYARFCKEFKYSLTRDQKTAIHDIRQDLESGKTMDRLICGDVGFGKTEVMMHAVFFLAIGNLMQGGQALVIVPTMTLARQHYLSFKQRFQNFNVKIVHLSRLESPKSLKASKQMIEDNEAQIIVGTHAALASSIKFANLLLLVIDEEQHFGVNQKEKLKNSISNIHALNVSATPIPRTLQISMAGIKDLSLIATPPMNRLPVKTIVDAYSLEIVREALTLEKERGGQSLYICPRIQYIEEAYEKLSKIMPASTIEMLHGQMKANIIEQKLNDFYEGKFEILISTNIVESGLDIPRANTIIIDKVEMLGLSQLYQLRGRVGRHHEQGYAYLLFNKQELLTKQALKRLEVMENIDYLGAGFTIASHDMDIRGFGNILGKEQAGHIREVGVELYNEMLQEAIASLQNQESSAPLDDEISISMAIPVYIPENYVVDSNLRLALYKRIGNLSSLDTHQAFELEMLDRFGRLPIEMQNLLSIVLLKFDCKNLGILKLDVGLEAFSIKLSNSSILIDKLIDLATQFPNKIKIRPDNKVVILKDIPKDAVIGHTKALLDKLKNL